MGDLHVFHVGDSYVLSRLVIVFVFVIWRRMGPGQLTSHCDCFPPTKNFTTRKQNADLTTRRPHTSAERQETQALRMISQAPNMGPIFCS